MGVTGDAERAEDEGLGCVLAEADRDVVHVREELLTCGDPEAF